MNFDHRRNQGLPDFDDCWLRRLQHLGNRRDQCLQQWRDGRDRRQDRCRRFDHGNSRTRRHVHQCSGSGDRLGSKPGLLGITGLLFKYRSLELIDYRFGLGHLRQRFNRRQQFLGHLLKKVVQIRLQRQLRARCELQWPVHGHQATCGTSCAASKCLSSAR
ncbi:hypothetical protein D3C87_1407240 [compost metagenome]